MSQITMLLEKCELFKGFNDEEIREILQQIKHSIRKVNKGKFIFFRGDEYNKLIIVVKGSLSAEIHNDNGKVIKIENLNAPTAVATGILYASDPYLPVTLIANEDSTILSLPRETITALCLKNRTFLLNFMRDTGDKIVLFSEKMRLLQFNTIRQKLSSYLLGQCSKLGKKSFVLPYSIEQLSEIFGVARPSLSRVFSEFCKDEYIYRENKNITILDKSGLKEIVQSEE